MRFHLPQNSLFRPSTGLRKHLRKHLRNGIAAVETAVCLPFMVLLVFAGVEFSNAVFLKQSVNLAATEAAKIIIQPGDHNMRAEQRIANIMQSRRVMAYTYTVIPPVDVATARGVPVTVEVEAPANSLSLGPISFMRGKTMSAAVTMARM